MMIILSPIFVGFVVVTPLREAEVLPKDVKKVTLRKTLVLTKTKQQNLHLHVFQLVQVLLLYSMKVALQ